MPISTWFAPRSRAPQAWVGVQSQTARWLVARTDGERQGRRPRVLACDAVGGGMDGLRKWWGGSAARRDRPVLLLEPGEYQSLQINTPEVDASEVRAAARWQLKDLIDFPVDQAAIDCFALPGDSSATPRLQVVVTRQELVTRSVARWRDAGLALRVIDVPEMALRNLAVLAAGDQACAFLHVGLHDSRLLLLWQQELCVSRQLPIAGQQLAGMDEWQRNDQIERLALEIQRSVDAFGRQFSGAHLSQLWVSSVHDAAGLAGALAAQVSLPAEAFVPADWIDFDDQVAPFDLQQGLDHSFAIGAALRDEATV